MALAFIVLELFEPLYKFRDISFNTTHQKIFYLE